MNIGERPRHSTVTLRRAALGIALAAGLIGVACGGSTTGPSAADLSGTWSGTGTYPNAPFQLTMTQTGTTLRGSYSDRLDRSISVGGTLNGSVVTLAVDFGDAQLHFEGTVETAERMTGTMRTSALGNRPYPFTMNSLKMTPSTAIGCRHRSRRDRGAIVHARGFSNDERPRGEPPRAPRLMRVRSDTAA